MLNCTRQWGKSTIAAAKAVHRAYTRPESLVLVASPSRGQSGEFVQKAAEMVARLRIPVRGDGYNDVSLAFPNRSRIVGLRGIDGTARGFSAVSLLLIDEASRVEVSMYTSAAADAGGGERGFVVNEHAFMEKGVLLFGVEHGGEKWHRIKVTALECPRISREFLEESRSCFQSLGTGGRAGAGVN